MQLVLQSNDIRALYQGKKKLRAILRCNLSRIQRFVSPILCDAFKEPLIENNRYTLNPINLIFSAREIFSRGKNINIDYRE